MLLGQRHPVVEALQVVGHAPTHRVGADPVLRGVVRHEQRRGAIVERSEVQLSSAPAVHLPGEHVTLEEGHLAAGEDEHQAKSPGGLPPPPVQEAAELAILRREVLELIEDHDRAPGRGVLLDRRERGLPARERLSGEQLVAPHARQLAREIAQLVLPGRVGRLEVERTLALDEMVEQLRLANAPPAPQHEEAGIVRRPALLERGELIHPVQKLHSDDLSAGYLIPHYVLLQ